jgi:uncharacterized protein DUF2628
LSCRLNTGSFMPAYAVFEPPRRNRSDSELADRFVFLRERFGWGAFLFGPLWMIWRRLWRVLIFYLVLTGLLAFGLSRMGVSLAAWTVIALLVDLLLGLEATNLRRWSLIGRGWHDRGTVIADDLAMAEWRFFNARQSTPAPGPNAAPRNDDTPAVEEPQPWGAR